MSSSDALSPGAPSAGWFVRYIRSTVGAKHMMALTGMALLLFVVQHMIANLVLFAGPEVINEYAHWLKSKTLLVWGGRTALFVTVVLHAAVGLRLAWLNTSARPVSYHAQRYSVASPFGRTMAWSGLLIALFVVYHLLHFTVGTTDPLDFMRTDSAGRHDVYKMVVLGFSRAPVVLTYCGAMLLLGVHLSHGVRSMFQSLGLAHPRYAGLLRLLGPLVAALLVIGNVSMPLAVLSGLIRLPGGGM